MSSENLREERKLVEWFANSGTSLARIPRYLSSDSIELVRVMISLICKILCSFPPISDAGVSIRYFSKRAVCVLPEEGFFKLS